jgi:hypothetical protein
MKNGVKGGLARKEGMKDTLVTACIFLGTWVGLSSTDQAQLASLSATQTISIKGETATDFIEPAKIDQAGNIYLRYGMSDSSYRPVVKLSSDGRKIASCDIPAVSGHEGGRLRDFCIDLQGNLVALIRQENGSSYFLTFDSQGNFRSSVAVDENIDPYRMAFAGENTLVLSGRVPPRQQESSKRSGSEPLVVITNLNGKILKRVELPGDILPTKLQPGSRPPKMDMAFEEAVAGTVMDTGEDKNVYLARPGKTGSIYVISSRGLVLRRMPLEIPSDFLLYGLKAHGDELATVTIQHSDEGDRTQVERSELQIYTTATGELLHSYLLDSSISIALAGFQHGGPFIFVGSSGDATVTLYKAQPRP